ncbi:hypothetical protein E2C01_057554 [Portunus trituberculatus]|uniref:Uncharacterized protein n=1 Tax=Portunus trituberculatus TaxID=210409 RepID=A0A5B7H1E2_PORTR|nr:hypothetical protein [Portunus trituberculatus]
MGEVSTFFRLSEALPFIPQYFLSSSFHFGLRSFHQQEAGTFAELWTVRREIFRLVWTVDSLTEVTNT